MRSLLAFGVIAAALLCNSTASGQLQSVAIDDFEGLTLQDYVVTNVDEDSGRAVYTRTNPAFTADWTVDNSLMDPNWNDPSLPPGFDGWAVWESDYWIENQGDQDVRGIADPDFVATGNHFLLADPDAWDDYQTGASSDTGYGSWVEREYNLTGDLQTLEIEMDWEFAAEDLQIGLIQVSFDGKQTWSYPRRIGFSSDRRNGYRSRKRCIRRCQYHLFGSQWRFWSKPRFVQHDVHSIHLYRWKRLAFCN